MRMDSVLLRQGLEALIARRGDAQEVEFVTPNWGVFLGYEMQGGEGGHCFSLCFKSPFLHHTNVPILNSQFQTQNQPNSKTEAKSGHSFQIGRYHTPFSCIFSLMRREISPLFHYLMF